MALTAEQNLEFERNVLEIKSSFLKLGVKNYPSEYINNSIPKMSNKKHAAISNKMRALWHNRNKSKECLSILEAALNSAKNEFESIQ